jgi:type IV pilus assembly protein PilB
MRSHPDADAFIRAILHDPADATTRLVFADWLEETGEPANVAWANYIRLSAEASHHPPDSNERRDREWRASRFAIDIRAKLSIPASTLVESDAPLRELLPTYHFEARLSGFSIPRPVLELVPESVARENLVLPLTEQGRVLLMALPDPCDWGLVDKLRFILNRDVVVVRADGEDIRAAINRHYGLTETESVDCVFYEFPPVEPDLPLEEAAAAAGSDAVVRLVYRIIIGGIRIGADAISLTPEPPEATVRYRVAGNWVDSEPVSDRLWPGIAVRLANMAWLPADAILRRRAPIAGSIPLQVGNLKVSVRVSAGSQSGEVLLEFDNPPVRSTEPS